MAQDGARVTQTLRRVTGGEVWRGGAGGVTVLCRVIRAESPVRGV